jgi:hypothetical protein
MNQPAQPRESIGDRKYKKRIIMTDTFPKSEYHSENMENIKSGNVLSNKISITSERIP